MALHKINSSVFYKYFISYVAMLIIPLVIISAIFYYNSVNSLRSEIVQSNINKLGQVRDTMDFRIKELENIAMRISIDQRLTPYMVRQPYSGKQAIEELKRYKANSSIIDDMLLYYHGHDQVYSPSGQGSLQVLLNAIYPLQEQELNAFKDRLISVSAPVVQAVKSELIVHMYPVSSSYSTVYGTVIFFINKQVLTDMTENILGELSGNVYIFNDRLEVLTANHNGASLSSENIHALAASEPGVVNKQINHREYSVVTVQSEVSGWTFVTAIPTAQFYAKVADMRSFIIIVLMFITLVGLGTAMILTFRQYRPVRSLSQYLQTREQHFMAAQVNKDEFARIRDTMELVFDDSEQLREKVNVQQPFVRDQCLMRLLKGGIESQQETSTLMKNALISMEGKYFFVAMFGFNQESRNLSSQNREKILQLLSHVTFLEGEAYGIELIHENAIVLIVNMYDEQRSQRQFVEELVKHLKDYEQSTPTIGVGTIYEGMGLINRSFIEAQAAAEYAVVKNEGRVLYFDEVVEKEDKTYWYPVEEKVKFTQSLKQGNVDVAREMLSNMFESIRDKEISIHVLRCICFDLINAVLKTVMEMGMNHYTNDIRILVEFHSIGELHGNVQSLVAKICREVEQKKESHNHDLRDQILEYIHHQFKRHDLSLEQIADTFQISISYLSRFLKDQSGMTFTQLVWKLRVEEAKRQLIRTDHSIKQIVQNIGYVDVANFTRKFRTSEGITPGQFRVQHKHHREINELHSV